MTHYAYHWYEVKNAMRGPDSDLDLEEVEIHSILSNERRRYVIEFLRETEGSLPVRDLSERIAEIETGESPPPSNIRQSAYVSLHQTHLPKLDELGIVDYDGTTGDVKLTDRADQLQIYMEIVPKYGLTWSEYYIGASVLGLLLVIAADIGVPFLAAIGSLALALLTITFLLASAIYQAVTQETSLLHRLAETAK